MEAIDRTIIIGERINPTGRKDLAEELAEGKLDIVLRDAKVQAEAGADLIDVNVGMPGVDEISLLSVAAKAVVEETGLPVCIDSSEPEALIRAMETCSEGIAMVNSVTGDSDVLDAVLPVASKSEVSVIGLTKTMKGIPESVEGRLEIARSILAAAGDRGIEASRIFIDFLAFPASAKQENSAVTLECLRTAGEKLESRTVLGASNISFGMPERSIINAAFLSMAIDAGLNAAIINPLEPGLVFAVRAADFLAGRDKNGRAYLKHYRSHRSE